MFVFLLPVDPASWNDCPGAGFFVTQKWRDVKRNDDTLEVEKVSFEMMLFNYRRFALNLTNTHDKITLYN